MKAGAKKKKKVAARKRERQSPVKTVEPFDVKKMVYGTLMPQLLNMVGAQAIAASILKAMASHRKVTITIEPEPGAEGETEFVGFSNPPGTA